MGLQKKAIGASIYFIDRDNALLFTFAEVEKARVRYKNEKAKALVKTMK